MATPSEADADVKGLQTASAVRRRPWALSSSSRRRRAEADSRLEVARGEWAGRSRRDHAVWLRSRWPKNNKMGDGQKMDHTFSFSLASP